MDSKAVDGRAGDKKQWTIERESSLRVVTRAGDPDEYITISCSRVLE